MFRPYVFALPVLLACAPSSGADDYPVEVLPEERAFTIETGRMRVTFQDGMIVAVKNLVTGELHADRGRADYGMPRGMGHMRGGVEAMESLHVPWHTSSMLLAEADEIFEIPDQRDYAVYFRPHEDSEFSTRPIENGVEATWRGLGNGEEAFPDDSLTIRAQVDPETGHLLFQATGRSRDQGVFGVQAPLTNLAEYHRFHVPSFGGVMIDRHMKTGLKSFAGLRNFLEARVLGIEGKQGSLGLWAQDEQFHDHYLFHHWDGRSFSVAFEHLNLMPFENHEVTESVVYRLDVFDGGWVDAMTPYRNWYRELFKEEMALRATPEWADRIRIIVDNFSQGDSEMYAQLADMFEPDTVMFHEWNARAAGFDRELPDWTPREEFSERVRQLQEFGFRTMAYVNTYCVNYNSPVFREDNIAEFGLTRKMTINKYGNRKLGEDQQSQWRDFSDGELLYLDPLSSEWRKYHTDMMIEWNEETGVDANYEDVLGTAADFGNGTLEGIHSGQGAVAQVRDLLRRNPGVPMASEYGPENVAFGVRWPLCYLTVWGSTEVRLFWTERSRPVSAYIHGPLLRAWVPILRAQDDVRRHWVMSWSDALGGLAQLRGNTTDLSATKGPLALQNYRAKLFSSLQLTPYFVPDREDDHLVCLYQDEDGGVYRYQATETVQELIDPAGKPLYQRIRGEDSFQSSLAIRGWPARDGDRFLGLNPDVYYPLMPEDEDSRNGPDIEITSLPDGIMVRRYYDKNDISVLALEKTGEQSPESGAVELFTRAEVRSVVVNDATRDAPAWNDDQARSETRLYETEFPAYFVFVKDDALPVEHGPLESPDETGVHLSPATGIDIGVDFTIAGQRPWEVPDAGGTGEAGLENFRRTSGLEEVTLDYLIRVPDEPTSLVFYLKTDQNVHGNGVIARLYLNGRMVRAYDFGAIANPEWKAGMDVGERDLWPEQNVHRWRIPLGDLAGEPALVTIGTDYKNSTNADSFWWSKPILTKDRNQSEAFVEITEGGEVEAEDFRMLPADFVVEEGRSHAPGGY
ncbi:MAG: DUF6259 domain-containing protein [Verrucomicrobiales bacterium]